MLSADEAGVADVIGAARLVLSQAALERAAASWPRRRAQAASGGRSRERPQRDHPARSISEKSYALIADNKYTFRVHPDAHKTQIRQAVEEIFERARARRCAR